MPSEAARLDPGAARRGGCFNPPQYRPETNLLGFRVLTWKPAGRVMREALDRAKTPSPQRKRLKFASLICDGLSSTFARGGHVAWPIDTASDGWLWQFRRKQAAEDSSGEGCCDSIASASRALQLERVESQKRLPHERPARPL